MKIGEVFSSGNTVKSEDVKAKGSVSVTIAGWSIRAFDDDKGNKRNKIVLSLKNTEKTFVVNLENATRISALYGDDTEAWIGKKITLRVDKVKFGSKLVDGIRVYPPGASAPVQPAPPPQDFPDDDMADEIPF